MGEGEEEREGPGLLWLMEDSDTGHQRLLVGDDRSMHPRPSITTTTQCCLKTPSPRERS